MSCWQTRAKWIFCFARHTLRTVLNPSMALGILSLQTRNPTLITGDWIARISSQSVRANFTVQTRAHKFACNPEKCAESGKGCLQSRPPLSSAWAWCSSFHLSSWLTLLGRCIAGAGPASALVVTPSAQHRDRSFLSLYLIGRARGENGLATSSRASCISLTPLFLSPPPRRAPAYSHAMPLSSCEMPLACDRPMASVDSSFFSSSFLFAADRDGYYCAPRCGNLSCANGVVYQMYNAPCLLARLDVCGAFSYRETRRDLLRNAGQERKSSSYAGSRARIGKHGALCGCAFRGTGARL